MLVGHRSMPGLEAHYMPHRSDMFPQRMPSNAFKPPPSPYQLPVRSGISTYETRQPIVCKNCLQTHTDSQRPRPTNCFYITIRRSGRKRLSLQPSQTVSVSIRAPAVPHSRSNGPGTACIDHIAVRDYIWKEFEDLKAEVDDDRDEIHMQSEGRSKGRLKEKAPIPWLSWCVPNGQSGQTRSKENFFKLWDRVAASCSRDHMIVSSVLLPLDGNLDTGTSDNGLQ